MGRGLDRGLRALLLLGFYYNAYRYPLQINDSGTSPTYADTPLWLSLGKYLLASLLFVLLVLVRLGHREPIRLYRPLHVLGYALLALLPIVSGVLVGELSFVTTGFFFLLPLILLGYSGWTLSYRSLNRLLAASVWIAVSVEVVQVALFALVGRLPALAYSGSISVRFGSFLDDPNGFGLLVCWLAPFAAVYFRGWRRSLSVGLLLVSLLLTQSLTAVGSVVAVSALLTMLYISEHPRLAFPALAVTLLGTLLLGTVAYLYRRELLLAFELYMFAKQGSILAHAESLTVFGDMALLNLLGIQPLVERWVETGYVNLLSYFGLVYVLVYLALGVAAALWYVRIYKDRSAPWDARCFAFAALGLLGAVYLGNLNLPVVSIFPLDLFAALLLGLASARPKAAEANGAGAERPEGGGVGGALALPAEAR